jgi:hypothetical protein
MGAQIKLFEIEPLSEPRQIGFVWYDKMNLVQKSKFMKKVKVKDFFNDFLYKQFDNFDQFLNSAINTGS